MSHRGHIHHSKLPPVEWAERVNRSWLVRNRLNENADRWIHHLAATDPERLEHACRTARAMCGMRETADDPKPWFYAGLFSSATPDEATEFLTSHRVTRAALPSMQNDPEVGLWLDRVGPETMELIQRIRGGLARCL